MISLIPTDEDHLSDHFILVAEAIEGQISMKHEQLTYLWYVYQYLIVNCFSNDR